MSDSSKTYTRKDGSVVAKYKPLRNAMKEIGDDNLLNWGDIGVRMNDPSECATLTCQDPTTVKDCRKAFEKKKQRYTYDIGRYERFIKKHLHLVCEDNKCICGVNIQTYYMIYNKNLDVIAGLGSVCKDHWQKEIPDAFKMKCRYCKEVIKKRNHNSLHKRCEQPFKKQQLKKKNLCEKCKQPVGNPEYTVCYKCKFRNCERCKKRNVKTESIYIFCYPCHKIVEAEECQDHTSGSSAEESSEDEE